MPAFDSKEFEKYELEVKEKWGKTASYNEYIEKTKHYSKDDWNNFADGMNNILSEFAICMKNGEAFDSDASQALVKTLQNHITNNCYNCTDEILVGLGKMYVADERFKNNIDTHAKGTAEFINKAIEAYCSKVALHGETER
ncbi:MAG: TipAS antibiotic-recognition domain-containing protein [Lachnospiraceae bacterium]|nr:TipAS antibiotic-recognition domain-containing protein [Lachnospiraceae bacterium]